MHAVGSGGVDPAAALSAAAHILPQIAVACLGDDTPPALLQTVLGSAGGGAEGEAGNA